MENHIFDFVGSDSGQWKVLNMKTIVGEGLEPISHLSVVQGSLLISENSGIWTLKGLVSNVRYAEKDEKEKLAAVQEALGRPQATMAALIP
jgi:hypothetical protein